MKKTYFLFILALLYFSVAAFAQQAYYVTPTGSSSNDGSSFNSPLDLFTALDIAVAGDEIILSGETFTIPYTSGEKNTIELSKSGSSGNYITIRSTDNTIATIDFSFPDMAWVQDSYGLYITGNYWYFKGLKITRAGYQGAYVTGGYNTFENCIFYDNRNTGLEINKGGNNTTVINCDAYYNYDPKKGGSMADGFGPKQTQGPGNSFIGCRAWYNSDDGYDCYDSPEVVTFENCWAFNNGIDVWQFSGALEFAGNGNGFKVGGNYKLANNVLTNCVAFGHPNKGFDQNNNTGGLTIYNCTSYNNGTNFGLGNDLASGQSHVLRNNISLNGSNSISNATQSNNTWNSGFSVGTGDFVSLDLGLATITRYSDGSIPGTNLFRLNESSSLIDAGVNVGLPYSGSAPDLGAFEYEGNTTVTYTLTTSVSGSGSVSGAGTYDAGTVVTLTATPSAGWLVSNWSGVDNSNGNIATVTMNGNKSVSVTFIEENGNEIEIIIQENTTGFCSVDGSVDNNNSGYTGDGFANTDNETGKGIDYKVNVGAVGAYTVEIRYAATNDRPANLIQNGSTVASNISLPSTGAWTTWITATFTANLSAGISDLRLEATGSNGLPNIDYLKISGENISTADCNGIEPETFTLSTSVIGSGSVSPSGGTYDEGTTVTLTATPSGGWQFSSWGGDASGTSITVSITMNSNKNVTATFAETVTGTISLSASAGNGQVYLNWSSADISNNFEVYRDLDSDPIGRVRIATVANSVTSYTDASVSNGTTYYYWIKSSNVSDNEINSNVASATPVGTSVTEITIQENETGFCSVDGSVDNDNSGFTGSGFANTANATGNGVEWAVTFGASDNYTFLFQYASATDRPADLIVNGTTVASNISFPATGSWTSWSSVSTTANVSSGSYIVRLEATGSSGLGNIDYVKISGVAVEAYDCSILKSADQILTQNEGDGLSHLKVYPNPTDGFATVQFSLKKPARVAIKLNDVTGKLVDNIMDERFEDGDQVVSYSTAELKSGIYIISIQTGLSLETVKLAVE